MTQIEKHPKYIFITGGVISGVGKGIISSSIGMLMKCEGLEVSSIKIDPYLNIDAGTLKPQDHGEVFVLKDGGEVDLDLGNYERFLDLELSRDNNITTGKIYSRVIEKERRGDYLGKTVQVVPHITDEIMDWISRVASQPINGKAIDVCMVELGGTVGDIESAPFVEAIRQFQRKVGASNCALIHVGLLPIVSSVGELKTKPLQHSVQALRGLGLIPDIVCCRSSIEINQEIRDKVSLFCDVDHVLHVHDLPSLYHVPRLLKNQNAIEILKHKLQLQTSELGRSIWTEWEQLILYETQNKPVIRIAIIGKYTALKDSYVSIVKALEHASFKVNVKCEIEWIEAGDLEDKEQEINKLGKVNGIICAGGFGSRGVEGKIKAIKYARENRVPFLGICLGLQLSVIEYARNELGIKEAHSEEFQTDCKKLVMFMPEIDQAKMGGTMRLGEKPTYFHSKDSHLRRLYGEAVVHERHRHRYEVNPAYIEQLEAKGQLRFVGKDETGNRMEIMEYSEHYHPYFVATQYHPEYKTRPLKPSPPFLGLVINAKNH